MSDPGIVRLREIVDELLDNYQSSEEAMIWERSGNIDNNVKHLKAEVEQLRAEVNKLLGEIDGRLTP